MNMQVLQQLRHNIEVKKNEIFGGRKPIWSYRLSMKSQREWAEWERQENLKRAVVAKARRMIEWSHSEYERALVQHKHNLKVFTELTLNWSPERIMSTHKDFKSLCRVLNNEEMWRMLSRKERRFVADAVGVK